MRDLEEKYLKLYQGYISGCDFTMSEEFVEQVIRYRIRHQDFVLERNLKKLESKIRRELKAKENAFELLQMFNEYKNIQTEISMHKFIAEMIARYAEENNYAISEEIKEVLNDN